jgi:C-terminal processing protease CtpA/Prc
MKNLTEFFLGGRDFGSPLQIQYVNPNSLAEQCGVRIDDYIIRIGQISTEYLQHKEAQEQIKRQNNIVELILQRLV